MHTIETLLSKPIETEEEYDAAMDMIEYYYDNYPEDGTKDSEILDKLEEITYEYYSKTYPSTEPTTTTYDLISNGTVYKTETIRHFGGFVPETVEDMKWSIAAHLMILINKFEENYDWDIIDGYGFMLNGEYYTRTFAEDNNARQHH
jgi:hypothetical protein